MGRIQEALKKAEESRARNATGAAGSGRDGAAAALGTGSATSFALSAALRDSEVDPHVIALLDPQSPIAEEYRTLRANLQSLSSQEPLKVFVVTSAVPNEGKSLTCMNLACILAEDTAKRVVVVDADLRRPTVHKLLGIDNQRGIADYLGGGTMLEMVIQRSRVANLWALPSGRVPPNPAELLGSKRMDDLMARLRRDYDYVVIDAPPVVSTTDAGCVAPRADGTILVVRMERTPKEVSRHAVELLKQVKATVVGTVLTGLEND